MIIYHPDLLLMCLSFKAIILACIIDNLRLSLSSSTSSLKRLFGFSLNNAICSFERLGLLDKLSCRVSCLPLVLYLQTIRKKSQRNHLHFVLLFIGPVYNFQWRFLDVRRCFLYVPPCTLQVSGCILHFHNSHPWQPGYVLVWSSRRSASLPSCRLNVTKMRGLSPLSHTPGSGPVKY